ncbi:unnamed protein product [Amoebophrya sp. A25]|nr:unnamed protein product [Amoebophrya sp. A25]|eukprot:GSA25T00009942001.1
MAFCADFCAKFVVYVVRVADEAGLRVTTADVTKNASRPLSGILRNYIPSTVPSLALFPASRREAMEDLLRGVILYSLEI